MTSASESVIRSGVIGQLTHSIRRLKVLLLLLLVLIIGIGLTVVAQGEQFRWFVPPKLLRHWPYLALGEALISASVVGFVYEWYIRKENEESTALAMKSLLEEQHATLRDQLAGDAYEPSRLERLSQDGRSVALRSSLRAWIGDRGVANEVERIILPQLAQGGNYWSKVRYELTLTPDVDGGENANKYLDAHVVCEYESQLARTHFQAELSPFAERSRSLVDAEQPVDFVWTLGSTHHYQISDKQHFGYNSVHIDDIELMPTTAELPQKEGGWAGRSYRFTADGLDAAVGTRVRHRVSLKFKQPKRGHYIEFPLIHTAMGLECVVHGVGDMGLHSINLMPFLQSGGPVAPRHTRTGNSFVASVRTDRCVFAGSGIVFAWNLDGEYDDTFRWSTTTEPEHR